MESPNIPRYKITSPLTRSISLKSLRGVLGEISSSSARRILPSTRPAGGSRDLASPSDAADHTRCDDHARHAWHLSSATQQTELFNQEPIHQGRTRSTEPFTSRPSRHQAGAGAGAGQRIGHSHRSHSRPSRADSSRADPSRADPSRADPSRRAENRTFAPVAFSPIKSRFIKSRFIKSQSIESRSIESRSRTGRICIRAGRIRTVRIRTFAPFAFTTPDMHQQCTRIKAGRASTTHAHQGRTCINDARASRPDTHQGQMPNAIKAGHTSRPNAKCHQG